VRAIHAAGGLVAVELDLFRGEGYGRAMFNENVEAGRVLFEPNSRNASFAVGIDVIDNIAAFETDTGIVVYGDDGAV